MAHVHNTVVEGTMKLLMWKESAAIVAVHHLSTRVSNTGKLHYCVEITSNKMRKFGKCSLVQTIKWNCFSLTWRESCIVAFQESYYYCCCASS